jgi:hypothetical protein
VINRKRGENMKRQRKEPFLTKPAKRDKGRSLSTGEIEALSIIIPTVRERRGITPNKNNGAAAILRKSSRKRRVSQKPDMTEPFPEKWMNISITHLPMSELHEQKIWLGRRIPFLNAKDSYRLDSYRDKIWTITQEIERRNNNNNNKKKRRRYNEASF